MAHGVDAGTAVIPIDRQGRMVIPRRLRAVLGPIPGIVRATRVDGGLLLEQPTTGEIIDADDGLPVLVLGRPVTNDEVLAAIDAERSER